MLSALIGIEVLIRNVIKFCNISSSGLTTDYVLFSRVLVVLKVHLVHPERKAREVVVVSLAFRVSLVAPENV